MGTYDGSTMRLYLNGLQRATKAASGTLRDSSRPLAIGNHPSQPYQGLIDDIRVYNVVLTADAVAALGRQVAPSRGTDLSIHHIERTPKYSTYSLQYEDGGYDPILTPGTENQKRWPDVGETVTYRAKIANQGSSSMSAFKYRFLIDGNPVGSIGSVSSLAAGASIEVTQTWAWLDGDHTIALDLLDDSGLPLNDSAGVNDRHAQNTNALMFTLYVWDDIAQWAKQNTTTNMVGTKSMQDWAQWQTSEMNRLLATHGIRFRIAVDKTKQVANTVVDPGGTHAPEPCPTDGCWGFGGRNAEGVQDWATWIPSVWRIRDDGLIHEWGHQLGMIDLYNLDVGRDFVHITNPNGTRMLNDHGIANFDFLFDGSIEGTQQIWADNTVGKFILQLASPRAFNRSRAAFMGDTTNWQIWAGDDLNAVKNKVSPATRRGIVQTVTQAAGNMGDQWFSGPAAKYWMIEFDRTDSDRIEHINEWELYENSAKVDVAALLRASRVAGTTAMPADGMDIVWWSSGSADLMHGNAYFLTDYHRWALNLDANWNGRNLPLRRGHYGSYVLRQPTDLRLLVKRTDGSAVTGAGIKIYQTQDSQVPDVVKYAGTTDASGGYTIPKTSTTEYGKFYGATGAISTPSAFGTVWSANPSVVGHNGVLVVGITTGTTTVYRFLDLVTVGRQVLQGRTAPAVVTLQIP